jgi:aspartyl-tRNA(Asn)/glutamyl-tRNA(Gln) amidotransferase subunit A
MEYQELTIESAATLLSSRQISSFELTSALLDRIEKYDDEINAFITVDKTMALEQAKKSRPGYCRRQNFTVDGCAPCIKGSFVYQWNKNNLRIADP